MKAMSRLSRKCESGRFCFCKTLWIPSPSHEDLQVCLAECKAYDGRFPRTAAVLSCVSAWRCRLLPEPSGDPASLGWGRPRSLSH